MKTNSVMLRMANARDEILEKPMRFAGSHQAGFRLFFGATADLDFRITEQTEPSYAAVRFFDAIAQYRAVVEPSGWRLLHAFARADCWPRPGEVWTGVEQLVPGREETLRIEGLESAPFEAVVDLPTQQARFAAWMSSLSPVRMGRVRPRSGHQHDPAEVAFGPLSKAAAQILVTGRIGADRQRSDRKESGH